MQTKKPQREPNMAPEDRAELALKGVARGWAVAEEGLRASIREVQQCRDSLDSETYQALMNDRIDWRALQRIARLLEELWRLADRSKQAAILRRIDDDLNAERRQWWRERRRKDPETYFLPASEEVKEPPEGYEGVSYLTQEEMSYWIGELEVKRGRIYPDYISADGEVGYTIEAVMRQLAPRFLLRRLEEEIGESAQLEFRRYNQASGVRESGGEGGVGEVPEGAGEGDEWPLGEIDEPQVESVESVE